MNITCESEGRAGCVLLRALEPISLAGGRDSAGLSRMARNRGLAPDAPAPLLTSGPSRLCQALGITRLTHNGLDLLDPASPLQVREDGHAVKEVLVTRRIGLHVAADWPLRFAVPAHPCVSGPKSLSGKKISL
jgi:DNA-3-methyladenine glycosylase